MTTIDLNGGKDPFGNAFDPNKLDSNAPPTGASGIPADLLKKSMTDLTLQLRQTLVDRVSLVGRNIPPISPDYADVQAAIKSLQKTETDCLDALRKRLGLIA